MSAAPGTDAAPVPGEPPAAGLGRFLFVVVAAGWAAVLALILRHRLFVSQDTISNYGHVWYVAERLRHAHTIPFHMPVIGHGQAFAFPYGFLPWVTAALAWLALGSWAVTLWLVIGSVALVLSTFWAFPELGRGWLAAAALLDPGLVVAPIMGQLPFVWAAAMLLAAVACWRRGRHWQAALLAGLAQATHPAIVLPMGGLLVAAWWRWERDRRALAGWYALSLVVAVPATWLVVASPVFADTSLWVKVSNFVGTLGVRALVVAVPVLLVTVGRWRRGLLAPAFFAAALASNVVLAGMLNTGYAWAALDRTPNRTLLKFVDSPAFAPGRTYRILRAGDGKIGMYQLVVNGARLDSEFFPESIDRRSFPDETAYSSFLRHRDVDYVIVWDTYDRKYRTNEHALLDLLTAASSACRPPLVATRVVFRLRHAVVYGVDRACAAH